MSGNRDGRVTLGQSLAPQGSDARLQRYSWEALGSGVSNGREFSIRDHLAVGRSSFVAKNRSRFHNLVGSFQLTDLSAWPLEFFLDRFPTRGCRLAAKHNQFAEPRAQRVMGYAKQYPDFFISVLQRARFNTDYLNDLIDRLSLNSTEYHLDVVTNPSLAKLGTKSRTLH